MAKAIKEKHPDFHLYAKDAPSTLSQAYSSHIIENDSDIDTDIISGCDIIFLCAPVDTNISYLEILKDCLSDKMIITDVGSVKGGIHKKAKELELSGSFIGGHPMAGSEKQGFSYSSPDIIKGATYILTTEIKDCPKVLVLRSLLEEIGFNCMHMTPGEHDLAAAGISHLPHVLASILSNYIGSVDNGKMKVIASTGFRDTTRISSGDPDVWSAISLDNRDAILKLLSGYRERLDEFYELLSNENRDGIHKFLEDAKHYRDGFND